MLTKEEFVPERDLIIRGRARSKEARALKADVEKKKEKKKEKSVDFTPARRWISRTQAVLHPRGASLLTIAQPCFVARLEPIFSLRVVAKCRSGTVSSTSVTLHAPTPSYLQLDNTDSITIFDAPPANLPSFLLDRDFNSDIFPFVALDLRTGLVLEIDRQLIL